jgi:hypothetical protein
VRATSLAITAAVSIGVTLFAAPAGAHPKATSTLAVTSTAAWGTLHQNPHVVGRDNGQSAAYNGRSYWIFDDTILRNPDGFLSNSGASTADLDASNGIDLLPDNPFTESRGVPVEIVPWSQPEKAFVAAHAQPCASGDQYCGTVFGIWPGPVVADPARHRIIFSYGKLCRGAPDGTPCASGFVGTALGTGFAQLDMNTHQISRITIQNPDTSIWSPEGRDNTLLFPPNRTFGAGEMIIRDGILYAWGGCDSANVCGLAKVPADQLQNRLAWRYYTGTVNGSPQWSTDPAAAVSVGLVNGPAGGTVQWVPALNGYLNTYMDIGSTGQYQTAPAPWGPWTAAKPMFTGVPTNQLWDYAMFAHPEYSTRAGLTQYFSYYRPEDGQLYLQKVDFSVQNG